MPNFTDLKLPITLKISSSGDMIPLEFFGEVIPCSKKIQFKLGYFSTNSICTLSYGFAQFIYNGGTIDFLINHFVSENDYFLLNNQIVLDSEFYSLIEEQIITDLERLNEVLTKKQVNHFFNCLNYLIEKDRISIIPVTTRNGEISHYKEALFWDSDENVINIVGSCNFTYKGIVCNGESFIINRSWGEASEKANIDYELNEYRRIFKKESKDFIYLEKSNLVSIIKLKSEKKEIYELLNDEIDLLKIDEQHEYLNKEELNIVQISKKLKEKFQDVVVRINKSPKFPGGHQPRDYQIQAYENWNNNQNCGVFAMATGTGKTITSLNCVLQEYIKTGTYKTIILVPSIALLEQWEKEVEQFNFKKIIKIGGGNKWEQELASIVSNKLWKREENYILISTYGSFTTEKFQKYFVKIQSDLILIADEAHNIGAPGIRKILPTITTSKKIGLSATPKRVYDLEGTEALNVFFNDSPPYTYEFGMERALSEGFLTEYKYFPKIVQLNEDESERYIEISKKLLKFFDFEKGEFKKDPIVETLLLKRKNIIHKAHFKINTFKQILKELSKINKLHYIFTYVPEGYIYNEDGGSGKLLNEFLIAAAEQIPGIKMNSYTTEDNELNQILRGFSEGKIDMLFAMKMLDEGVDVPRAEVGIFCSSTGNPRQFIQRRGRLLRKHSDKAFATIYDMVVIPNQADNDPSIFSMERNLVKNELRRVAYFSSLSMNFYDSRNELDEICSKYELNLNELISEL